MLIRGHLKVEWFPFDRVYGTVYTLVEGRDNIEKLQLCVNCPSVRPLADVLSPQVSDYALDDKLNW